MKQKKSSTLGSHQRQEILQSRLVRYGPGPACRNVEQALETGSRPRSEGCAKWPTCLAMVRWRTFFYSPGRQPTHTTILITGEMDSLQMQMTMLASSTEALLQ